MEETLEQTVNEVNEVMKIAGDLSAEVIASALMLVKKHNGHIKISDALTMGLHEWDL